jgi:hypothetical protein
MKYLLFSILLFLSPCFSAEPVLDYKNSIGGIATVAGHVTPRGAGPFLISVGNGGLSYSTLTDSNGNWGIVFRHLSPQFDVALSDLPSHKLEGQITDSLID